MKVLGFLFLFIFLFFIVGLMATFYYIRKGVKFFKRAASGEGLSDEDFERMANKHYKKKETPEFDKDYFKGSGSNFRQRQQHQQQANRRTTRTASGVTIIDDRDPSVAHRKIFDHDEGEYVDFTEE